MLDKRYQAFVSSTYTDLVEERAEVLQALLELDFMPAGMELFPAASEEQWNWIRRVIDESDYYIVIIGGRYGSISKATGLSYTEMEYRYAVERSKPVIAFLHQDPSLLPVAKTDTDPEVRAKLDDFCQLVQQRLCKRWSTSADLGAKVSRGITQLIKQRPAVGWVRADSVSIADSQEVLQLRRRIDELEGKLRLAGTQTPVGTQHLAQGNDPFEIGFTFMRKHPKVGKSGQKYWVNADQGQAVIKTTWDEIFTCIAPSLIENGNRWSMWRGLTALVEERSSSKLSDTDDERYGEFSILDRSLQTIKVQLRALGLIAIDEDGGWLLTPYGDNYMTRLLGVSRKQGEPVDGN